MENDHPVGSLWFKVKEFLPNYEIKYDMYFKTPDQWIISEKDIILQESPELYLKFKEKCGK